MDLCLSHTFPWLVFFKITGIGAVQFLHLPNIAPDVYKRQGVNELFIGIDHGAKFFFCHLPVFTPLFHSHIIKRMRNTKIFKKHKKSKNFLLFSHSSPWPALRPKRPWKSPRTAKKPSAKTRRAFLVFKIHVEVAFEHAVIELAFAVGLFAKELFKLFRRADDIRLEQRKVDHPAQ